MSKCRGNKRGRGNNHRGQTTVSVGLLKTVVCPLLNVEGQAQHVIQRGNNRIKNKWGQTRIVEITERSMTMPTGKGVCHGTIATIFRRGAGAARYPTR